MDGREFDFKIGLPDYAQKVARILLKEGFKAYLVGGALRDALIGKEINDYDLATNATPEQMLKIFPKAVATGAKFGTIYALMQDGKGETFEVQVTTFRAEEQYINGRWPTKVEFIDDLDADLARRDFTFNAMALDLSSQDLSGAEEPREWRIYDPFNGRADLAAKVVRAVGNPLERFNEDGLRAYKACRLAAQLEFEIETETFEAIKKCLVVAKQISPERIRDEFMKMLLKSPKPSRGIDLMRQSGLLELFMPELLEGYGVEQKLFHADDVYWHNLKTCDIAPDKIKLAALLHDIGKPRKDMGNGNFYGHDVEGAKIANEIMRRLRFSNNDIAKVITLVKNHMFYYPVDQEDLSWNDPAVRRFIARVGEENIDDLFALRIADAASNPASSFDPVEIEALERRISIIREQDMALKISDLAITGNDLMKELNLEPSPLVGQILGELLEMVLEDPATNVPETLLDKARQLIAEWGKAK